MAQTMNARWGDSEAMEDGGGAAGSKGVRRVPSEAFNVLSDSEETKARRQSLKNTHSSATRRRSRNALREKSTKAAGVQPAVPAQPALDSQWIHRDKLAEIEIKEMEAAGIDVTPYRRSMSAGANGRNSRSQSRNTRRPSEAASQKPAFSTEDYTSADPRIPPIPSAPSEDERDLDNGSFDPTTDTEFRTLAELAEANPPPRSASNPLIRPSTSRIPLSKASPVPVPATVVDRDSPLPRSRTNSNAWSPNGPTWDDTQYSRRARSNSIGSAALLDDDRPGSSPQLDSSGSNASPPKARGPKNPPSSRKPLSTTTSKEQRPTSRGHASRPSTSRAPEGEAPWIASMYKPDPRLPPDQQMLPTHAKRMMQQQWEAEGKTGTAYDRDLRLLNTTQQPHPPRQNGSPKPLPSPPSPSYRSAEQQNGGSDSGWPLTPKSEGAQSPGASSRPGTSGGYRITPTITSPPVVEKAPSPVKRMSMTAAQQQQNGIPRMEEKEDEGSGKKKGGCGCCVVM